MYLISRVFAPILTNVRAKWPKNNWYAARWQHLGISSHEVTIWGINRYNNLNKKKVDKNNYNYSHNSSNIGNYSSNMILIDKKKVKSFW